MLTTGTDEHGAEGRARRRRPPARRRRSSPTSISDEFRSQWEILGLDIDRFKRTTRTAASRDACRICSSAAASNGYVYKGSYTGQYCVFDELYVNDAKPGDPCPDCGRPTETVTEENYFFKLSAFQESCWSSTRSSPISSSRRRAATK